jgi:hypothetical protein
MNDYYPPGSMKGSGIDAFEFDYGTFTCGNTDCLHDNFNSIAYGDDWGRWEVTCEECEAVHDTGSTNSEPEEDDSRYDEWKDEQLDD